MEHTQTHTLELGQVLADRFRVDSILGRGGQGHVYLGTQLALGRKVAIKTLNTRMAQWTEGINRFKREAVVIQSLTHPNTIRLYDTGVTSDGVLYIVMEFLDGNPLDAVLRDMGKLPISVVVDIGSQMLGALIEAHSQAIVHRDIKPSNIYLCRQVGAPYFTKLLDFGLARANIDNISLETQSGAVMGTPHYMSPEQALGETVDERSDLYSLALTLFELAVGKPAYDGKTNAHLLIQHVSEDPIPLPELLQGTRLGEVIARATSRYREHRYQTAEAMLVALSGKSSVEQFTLTALSRESSSVPDDTLDDSFSLMTPATVEPLAPAKRSDQTAKVETGPVVGAPVRRGVDRRLAALASILVISAAIFGLVLSQSDNHPDPAPNHEPAQTMGESPPSSEVPPTQVDAATAQQPDEDKAIEEPSAPTAALDNSDKLNEEPVVAEESAEEPEADPVPPRRSRREARAEPQTEPEPEAEPEPAVQPPRVVEVISEPEPEPEPVDTEQEDPEESPAIRDSLTTF